VSGARGGQPPAVRRLSLPIAAAPALAGAGCAGGTPQPAQVKQAAKAWASDHLPGGDPSVTLVIVSPGEHRARVRVKASGRRYDIGLAKADGDWRVTSSRRHA
jgi:hypothetical protein